jgi:uncharacterized repeat protein (TIGR03803 family)
MNATPVLLALCLNFRSGQDREKYMKTKTAVLLAVFVLVATGVSAGSEKVIWNFGGYTGDGNTPRFDDLATDGAGNFYGTTNGGGTYGFGVVFKLSPNAQGSYDETVLYEFTGNGNGSYPSGGLVFDKLGNIYGTTQLGGSNACQQGCGVVFELSANGRSWTETIIHSFGNTSGDGNAPVFAGVIFDGQGNLYGTTVGGGAYGNGTVFELSPSGSGWTESILHSFDFADGANPYGPVTADPAGNLFGTTLGGGAHGWGAVFELARTPAGWQQRVLHSFGVKNGEGNQPDAVNLTLDKSGNIYGTTYLSILCGDDGGTVWELVYSTATKSYSEEVLHEFCLPQDGRYAYGGVAMDGLGNLYGVTALGGAYGSGAVYRLTSSVSAWNYGIVYSFTGGTDGGEPFGNLLIDNKHLYGMANYGGTYGLGVVFEITP